jgi:glycosyltransferase involved in cell wall biosynthesis
MFVDAGKYGAAPSGNEWPAIHRPLLRGIKVLIITSGHDATDHRVHNKLACSLKRMGAGVAIVGMLEHRDPGEVEIIRIPKPATRMKRFLLQPWRCLWAARNYHPDIIHFHDAEILVTVPILKMVRPGCKLVYDVHEDFANLMLVRDWLPSGLKGISRILVDFIEKKLSLLADAIVGVTPPLTDKFRNEIKISAYNFITRDFFEEAKASSQGPREREFDLVHLGTLNLRRAFFLAESLKTFHKMRPQAKSLIIGASPEVSQKIRPLLPDNCVMMGEVPHSEIAKLLGNAKIGLDIHPWPGSHLDVALPVKICEYMASECAVVSSSMPVLSTILKKAGNYPDAIKIIEGGSPGDYAEAAVRLLEEIENGKRPGSELRAFALQHMIWENEADKIAGLYLELLGKRCVT